MTKRFKVNFRDIKTMEFDEGTVYELSDEKFIFDLMDFPKHDCFKMNSIFDIRSRKYKLVTGAGESGGYHGQILLADVLGM